MNKPAKEMFKELGYKLDYEGDTLIEYRKYFYKDTDYSNTDGFAVASFDLTDKEYFVEYFDSNEDNYVVAVSVDLHKAIVQQVKELGWL